jgi:Protein of unknown function (DUF664)
VSDGGLGGQSDERELLTGFLDWYRAVVERKAEGLTLVQASEPMTPSGLTVLGTVKHLAGVERLWLRWRFAGEDIAVQTGDNAVTFELDPADTIDSVLADYRHQVDCGRAITAGAALDDVSAREHELFGSVSLRWVLVHLLEETARHAGHLDLMRERIDGQTGD